jgi:hypothetical protein
LTSTPAGDHFRRSTCIRKVIAVQAPGPDSGHVLRGDEPADRGGANTGPPPFGLLPASMRTPYGSCLLGTVAVATV